MLIRVNQLTNQQLAALDLLIANCKRHDGNAIPVYRHLLAQQRPLPCNVLYFQGQELVGLLAAFFFYQDACEMAVMVAPSCRRQGIAKRMLTEILPLLDKEHIHSLIFSTAKGLNDNWLAARGFHYQHSEYELQRHSTAMIEEKNPALCVRVATRQDIASLCVIDSAAFPGKQADMAARFQMLLNDPGYRLFIASLDGMPVGKAHLHYQTDTVRFTDIAIIPAAQRQGFGRALLAHCINQALQTQQFNLQLEVETDNQNALRLYQSLGFAVINACDFWMISTQCLREGSW